MTVKMFIIKGQSIYHQDRYTYFLFSQKELEAAFSDNGRTFILAALRRPALECRHEQSLMLCYIKLVLKL